jgi:hypothetical protein
MLYSKIKAYRLLSLKSLKMFKNFKYSQVHQIGYHLELEVFINQNCLLEELLKYTD